jgi:hypothetical protein
MQFAPPELCRNQFYPSPRYRLDDNIKGEHIRPSVNCHKQVAFLVNIMAYVVVTSGCRAKQQRKNSEQIL